MELYLTGSDQSESPRAPGLGRDSGLMRKANNEIRRQSDTLDGAEPVGFFCECETAGCYAPVFLRMDDFDAMVAARIGWVLREGHAVSAAAARTSIGVAEDFELDRTEPADALKSQSDVGVRP